MRLAVGELDSGCSVSSLTWLPITTSLALRLPSDLMLYNIMLPSSFVPSATNTSSHVPMSTRPASSLPSAAWNSSLSARCSICLRLRGAPSMMLSLC